MLVEDDDFAYQDDDTDESARDDEHTRLETHDDNQQHQQQPDFTTLHYLDKTADLDAPAASLLPLVSRVLAADTEAEKANQLRYLLTRIALLRKKALVAEASAADEEAAEAVQRARDEARRRESARSVL